MVFIRWGSLFEVKSISSKKVFSYELSQSINRLYNVYWTRTRRFAVCVFQCRAISVTISLLAPVTMSRYKRNWSSTVQSQYRHRRDSSIIDHRSELLICSYFPVEDGQELAKFQKVRILKNDRRQGNGCDLWSISDFKLDLLENSTETSWGFPVNTSS